VLLWERVEVLPALNDTDFYLVLAEVGVESSLADWLRFRTAAQLRYDSAPAEDKEEADLFMTASLVAVY
jgi:putative salt-induced outer membrane protein YdiY